MEVLMNSQPKKLGRPIKSKDPFTERASARVTKDTYEALVEICKNKGANVKLADVVREAIEEYLENHN